jgi:hypothetical protein
MTGTARRHRSVGSPDRRADPVWWPRRIIRTRHPVRSRLARAKAANSTPMRAIGRLHLHSSKAAILIGIRQAEIEQVDAK